MGDPRKQRKKYITPKHPWDKARLEKELELVAKYGLRNKREIWRAAAIVRKYRRIAMQLQALPEDQREPLQSQILSKLTKLGVLPPESTLDDILGLTVSNVLDRRLQTVVYKKGLAKSIWHARQLITHRHIAVNGRVIKTPSYLVPVDEEDKVELRSRGG
uniref:Small ribosomal subunit protein uS4 n=1 Tax=uncultured korarchaeote TaxID=161241 RepID=A0A1L2JK03_9CREN|nr:ribosomal protein S4 [uncultured korarchaeote]